MATQLPFQLNTRQGEGSYLRQQFPKLYGALGGLLGTSPDEMQGSVLDPNTAAVREGAGMAYLPGLLAGNLPAVKGGAGMAALGGMFVGKSSKTWDALSATKALAMEKAGVDARKVWSETGNWKAPDGMWRQEIPDNTASVPNFGKNKDGKMFEVLDHKELYDAYPAQQYTNAKITSESNLPDHLKSKVLNEKSGAYLHGGAGGDHAIEVTSYTPENAKSTLLHEMQHAIQAKEGWVNGGSSNAASYLLSQAKSDALLPLYRAKSMVEEIGNKAGELSSAKYIKTLQDLSAKQGIKPSSITSMSPWYEYSDQIRANLGAMPKAAGSARDDWLNGAASLMYRREKQKVEMPEHRLNDYLTKDLPSLKREYLKVDRQRQKFLPEAKQYYETERKFNDLGKLSDHEQYRLIAGEAEARATQSRGLLDASQRRELFPEDSYDVPVNQLILRGLLGK